MCPHIVRQYAGFAKFRDIPCYTVNSIFMAGFQDSNHVFLHLYLHRWFHEEPLTSVKP